MVRVTSAGNFTTMGESGWAQTTHRYRNPGLYLVRVERTNAAGLKAVGCAKVRVGDEP